MPSHDSHDKPENIELIRDILLGPQKKEMDGHIQSLTSAIKSLESDTQKSISELQKSLSREIEKRAASLEKEIAGLHASHGTSQEQFLQNLEQMKSLFTESLENLNARLVETSSAKSREIADAQKALEKELISVRDKLYHDVEEQLQNLRATHLPRTMIGDLLMELGTKLKNSATHDLSTSKNNSGRS